MADRFARGVKRVWAGAGESDEETESWVESAGTRTLTRGDLRVGEVFARHGPPSAAHSAAAAAKERMAAANRQQVERLGQADMPRAAGKRPASPRCSAEQEGQRQKGSGSSQPDTSRAAGKRPMVSHSTSEQQSKRQQQSSSGGSSQGDDSAFVNARTTQQAAAMDTVCEDERTGAARTHAAGQRVDQGEQWHEADSDGEHDRQRQGSNAATGGRSQRQARCG
jgi:hypothetical protein